MSQNNWRRWTRFLRSPQGYFLFSNSLAHKKILPRGSHQSAVRFMSKCAQAHFYSRRQHEKPREGDFFILLGGYRESVTNKFLPEIFRDPASALSFSASLRSSYELPAFDSRYLAPNDNSRNAYAYPAGHLGDVVEDVRTVFERINDATIYIPTFYLTL